MTLATPIAQHPIGRYCPRHNPISLSPPPTGSRRWVMQSSRSSVNATCPTQTAVIPGEWRHQLTTPLSQWSGVPLFAGCRHSSTVEASMQLVSCILVALPARFMPVSETFHLVTSLCWRRAPKTSNSRLSQSVPKSCTKSLIMLRARGAAKRWLCPSYHIVMTSLNFVIISIKSMTLLARKWANKNICTFWDTISHEMIINLVDSILILVALRSMLMK